MVNTSIFFLSNMMIQTILINSYYCGTL